MATSCIFEPITHLQEILGLCRVGANFFANLTVLPGGNQTSLHILLMDIQACAALVDNLHLCSPLLGPQPVVCRRPKLGWGCFQDTHLACVPQEDSPCACNNGWCLTSPRSVF